MKSFRPAATSRCHPVIGEIRIASADEHRSLVELQKQGFSYEGFLGLLPPDDGADAFYGSQLRAILATSAARSTFLESHGSGGQFLRHQQLIARIQQLLNF